MNCFNHPDRPAVAQCPDCSKGLCLECATAHEQIICNNCLQKRTSKQLQEQQAHIADEAQKNIARITTERKAIIKEMVWATILGLIATVITMVASTTETATENDTALTTSPAILGLIVFGFFAGIIPAFNILSSLFKSTKPKKIKNQREEQTDEPHPIWFFFPIVYLYYFIYAIGILALLKLTVAFVIGIWILPFRLFRNLKRLNELKKMQASFKNQVFPQQAVMTILP